MRATLIAVLLAACAAGAVGDAPPESRASAPSSPPARLLVEGWGVDNVVVERSTAAEVVAEYGEPDEVIKHKKYSREMAYKKLGLSFYYFYEDAEKKIFHIAAKRPFKGSTTKGIVLGESTVADVLRIYGNASISSNTSYDYWALRYQGVEFYVENDGPDKEWPSFDGDFQGRLVTSIGIVKVEEKKAEEETKEEEAEP
ncbi:MAG TPA: hypothetical protein VFX96_20400 [Pyrinomonadaceae bacterium]|nr:hypothetical protein [Pyrinomonadaceae bacterium]